METCQRKASMEEGAGGRLSCRAPRSTPVSQDPASHTPNSARSTLVLLGSVVQRLTPCGRSRRGSLWTWGAGTLALNISGRVCVLCSGKRLTSSIQDSSLRRTRPTKTHLAAASICPLEWLTAGSSMTWPHRAPPRAPELPSPPPPQRMAAGPGSVPPVGGPATLGFSWSPCSHPDPTCPPAWQTPWSCQGSDSLSLLLAPPSQSPAAALSLAPPLHAVCLHRQH